MALGRDRCACFIAAISIGCGGDGSSDSVGASDEDGGVARDASVPVGGPCTRDEQCEGTCRGGVCATPTTTDGERSPTLGETDIDCGGPNAPPCALGLACEADDDCATTVCSAAKKCVSAVSCRGSNGPSGIETCGTGEPGTPGAVVESCCKSLPLPTTTTRSLDKYEITAGRFREFIGALAAANGGDPDLRTFAKNLAAGAPASQLGKVLANHPGLLDVLPSTKSPTAPLPLAVHLGAFTLDPMNKLDGCFVGPGSYGHATYWQDPSDLKAFGVGYPANAPDGVRKYPREVLDAKPMNCVMPLLMAAFCAWDGGELARTSDYHEIFGQQSSKLGALTVFYPWDQLLGIGQFNWRNGNDPDDCAAPSPIAGWPGCTSPQPAFYMSPSPTVPIADDESPYIAPPGRFPRDVTKLRSANGEGWFDVGGNMLEAAWPNTNVDPGPTPILDVCDTSATTGGQACTRAGLSGVRRFAGALPQIALIGYSFEGHARRSEAYLSSTNGDESQLQPKDLHPATFQYGKLTGRCVRSTPK